MMKYGSVLEKMRAEYGSPDVVLTRWSDTEPWLDTRDPWGDPNGPVRVMLRLTQEYDQSSALWMYLDRKDAWLLRHHNALLFAKFAGNTYYARFMSAGFRWVPFHHVIMGTPPAGHVTDHISGNGLDNRRCNLRFVTYSGNVGNRPLTTADRAAYKRCVIPQKVGKRRAYRRNVWAMSVDDWSTVIHYATHDEALRAAREYSRMAMANAS
jgi:hypothetical protein